MPALDTVVFLDPNTPGVTLRITVGHGQPGFTRVRLDGSLIASSDENDPTTLSGLDVDLGPPAPLSGTRLETTTIIQDFVPGTDQTSLTWQIDQAAPPLRETRDARVASGDRVMYSAKIRLRVP